MTRNDVRRLKSFLYAHTLVWPKWNDLGVTVNGLRALQNTSVMIFPKTVNHLWANGVYAFEATHSSKTWHFMEIRHLDHTAYHTLYLTGIVLTVDNALIETAVRYKNTMKFDTFKERVSKLLDKYKPKTGQYLFIKDYAKEAILSPLLSP
jgi:hypothetical protein